MVVHVRWDSDNSENIVFRSDLQVAGCGRLVTKSRVKIWWTHDGKCWKGTVVMTGRRATDTHDEDQASDDIKLASFVQDHSEVRDQAIDLGESILDPAESTLEAAVNALNSPSILDELITAAQHETTKDDDECVILMSPVPRQGLK